MKIIAGHKYIRTADGGMIPYSPIMLKAAGDNAKLVIADKDIRTEQQLPENDNIKPASVSKAALMQEPQKPQLIAPKAKLEHQDITSEMKQDLSDLK